MGTRTAMQELGGLTVLPYLAPNLTPRAGLIQPVSNPGGTGPAPDMRRGGRLPTLVVVQEDYSSGLTNAALIQAALDSSGYALLPTGTINVSTPIVVRAGQRLVGNNFGTLLRYTGAGNYAVVLGEAGIPCNAGLIEDINIDDAGLKIVNGGTDCAVSSVYVTDAAQAALYVTDADGAFDGPVTIRSFGTYGNPLHGVLVEASHTLDGLTFTHLASENNAGYGLFIRSVAATGIVTNFKIDHSTLQSNGSNSDYPAELKVVGGFHDALITTTHFESYRTAVPITAMDFSDTTISSTNLQPRNVVIGQAVFVYANTVTAQTTYAAKFTNAYRSIIQSLFIAGNTSALVSWHGSPQNDYKPTNLNTNLLADNKIVNV